MKKRIGVAASVFSGLFLQTGMTWAAGTNEGGALQKRWNSTFEAATHKRGVLKHVLAISLLILILMSFCSARADAALGDFRYSFGEGVLNKPSGVAVHPNGDAYVTDMANQRIAVFDSSGALINTWGSRGNGNGQFYYPSDIALDSDGKVYVTGTAYLQVTRVQEFTSTGTFIKSWGGPQGTGDGQFKAPNGIAIDSNENEMYVVDTLNNNVQVFSTSTGSFLRKWGSRGSGDGQLNSPGGIAVNSSGDVYVIDTGNSRVQVFDGTGTFLNKWGVNCSAGLGDPHVCEGDFSNPQGIAVDAGGNVYVADSHNRRVQVFSATGSVLGVWGLVYEPFGITVDGNGKVYVSDENFYSRINVYDGACQLIANAGPDQTVEQTSPSGASVTLDGSGTLQIGACSGELSYSWSWPGGGSATGVNPSVVFSAGTTTVYLTVTNGMQTATADNPVHITVHDTLPPTIMVTQSPPPNANGWNNTDVTVSFTCSDTGSGIVFCPASTTVTTEGTSTITGTAVDAAGHTATVPITLKIDKTPPIIIPAQNPLPNENGWNNTNVTVSYTCSDAGSGIFSCPTSTTVTTAGAGQILTGTAMDRAGNPAISVPIILNIDKTTPVITIMYTPTPGSVPTANYNVLYSISGKKSDSDTLVGGGGVYTYEVNAADLAGNTTKLTGVFNAVYNQN